MPKKTNDDRRAEEEEDRPAFGQALGEALAARGMTQSELGARLGFQQGTVSGWVTGLNPPERRQTVFELERALELPPGHLSLHLGYLPPAAAGAPVVDVETAIRLDPLLPEEAKGAFITLYRQAVKSSTKPPRGGRPRRSAG